MLYVTTRSERDFYTANRSLSESCAPDGGLFVPMRLPRFDSDAIGSLAEHSFSHNIAAVINSLFGTSLDGWTIEFGIGRYPVKMHPLNGKVTVAEAWHNPRWCFQRLVCGIEKSIRQSDQINRTSSDWLQIASRIAVLFAAYGYLSQQETKTIDMDLSVSSAHSAQLAAAWYAKKMGLPISKIIFSCEEENPFWNLLHKGAFRAQSAGEIPDSLENRGQINVMERLISSAFGAEEAVRFVNACRRGEMFRICSEQVKILNETIYMSVVGSKRAESTVSNLYHSIGFAADFHTARAYSGIGDYRASARKNNPALVMTEFAPAFYADEIARSLRMNGM